MYQHIVKSGITTEITYNLTHIDASTTKNTEINTIMSTELADNRLLCNCTSLKFHNKQLRFM